jgi:predicted transcriptional regulator
MLDKNSKLVIEHIYNQPNLSSKDIFDSLGIDVSYATLKRILAKLKAKNLISSMGKGRGTTYKISVTYELFYPSQKLGSE